MKQPGEKRKEPGAPARVHWAKQETLVGADTNGTRWGRKSICTSAIDGKTLGNEKSDGVFEQTPRTVFGCKTFGGVSRRGGSEGKS